MSDSLLVFCCHPDPFASGSIRASAETCACCRRSTGWAEVGHTELATHPEALEQLRAELRMNGWHDAAQLENFLTHLAEGATAMLFRCTVCDTHLACTDAS